MSAISLGFLVPSSKSIEVRDLEVLVDGKAIEDQKFTWTNDSIISISIELEANLAEILESSGFSKEDTEVLGLTCKWRSTRTGLHGASQVIGLINGANILDFTIPANETGGTLSISPTVILRKPAVLPHDSMAPSRIGSRLWSTSYSIHLEGGGSQFPISAYDFNEVGLEPRDVMWKIEISNELEYHISSAIRIHLNTGHPRVTKYLKDSLAAENLEFGLFLKYEIILQLLIFAFQQDPLYIRESGNEDSTLAQALLEVHGTYFPNQSFEETRQQFTEDPSRVFATIQARIFREEKARN